jgi:phage terminase small subunit
MKKLSEKQKRFIDYYVETGNATEAAKRAGYRGNNLNRIGSENLSKLDGYIKERMKELENERIATADEVLTYLTKVMRDEGLETKDRTKAAELLGKRHALFTEKIDGRIDNNIANKDNKAFKVDFSHLTTKEIKELLKDEDKG